MNAYDFDKTIYSGDSTADFYKYTFFHYPKTRKYLITTALAFFLYILGFYTKTRFKEKMYMFLRGIPDIDEALLLFWNEHEKNIKEYYKNQQKPDDIIISASPEFLLKPICSRLNITHLIASRVDPETGIYTGENCYGKEKVSRLNQYMSKYHIEQFYSDSVSDDPLGELAEESFIVDGTKIIPRHEYKPGFSAKIKHTFLAKEFMTFLILGVFVTLLCIAASSLFSYFIPVQAGFTLGYIISLIAGYLLNSFITFKKRLTLSGLIKYAISYIPNFIIQHVMVFITIDILQLPNLVSFVISAVLAVPITFLIVKIFAFGKK